MAIMIYSKISEIVSQYQNVFDVLWEKAIPFRDRMNQIQGIEVSSFAIRREVNYQPPAITDISDISDQKLTPPGMEYKNINKSIEKESARMLVDDQITNKQKTNPLSRSSIQIQLWSNDSKTHYAIKLSNQEEFLAATMSPTIEKYTALVEESAYIKDFQYDWDYTLMHWINNQK